MAALAAAVFLAAAVGGCEKRVTYSQETPQDVVVSLVTMVKTGQASRIDDLIYAESESMRSVLHHLGELLGQLQVLGAAVNERFPEDVARLRAEAIKAAETGEARGFSLNLGRGGARGGRGGPDVNNQFRDIATSIFADPYGWIDRNAERLSTMRLADDLATVTLDDQPVFPPLGIPLKLDGDKWYIALPTNLPGVSGFVPRTDTEWRIIGSMIQVLRQAVAELTEDVRRGYVSGIHELSDKAGEKVIWPALLTWGAYQRELDVRRRRDRLSRQFDKRQREWVKVAREAQWETPQILAGPIGAVIPEEIERLSRRNDRPNIERMSDDEFAEFIQGVLGAAGLSVQVERGAAPADVREAVSKWELGRRGPGLR